MPTAPAVTLPGMTTSYNQIGILGAGRVARALALALAPHSAHPLLLWARDPARYAGGVESFAKVALTGDLAALTARCDCLIFAVADDALGEMVERLAVQGLGQRPFLFHVSSRCGVAPLTPLAQASSGLAAIHPVMTFTGDSALELSRMAGARFAITASDDAALGAARAVVAVLGGVAIEIAEDRRALYHAALCHGANHLVTLMAGAFAGLTSAGVAEPAALLAPLVRAALDNSLSHGFAALSGPLLRGDRQTIAQHVQALAENCPTLLPAYRGMALATLDELDRAGSKVDQPGLRTDLDGWVQI